MSLASRVNKPAPPAVHGFPCSIGALIERLDKAEREALRVMLYDLGWNAGQVWEALRDEGHVVGRQSINRHRGGKCRCTKGDS